MLILITTSKVEKASKYLVAGLAKNKTMEEINRVTLKLFEPVKVDSLKMMTFDNGREFYPKSTNFKIMKEEDFQRAVDFIKVTSVVINSGTYSAI